MKDFKRKKPHEAFPTGHKVGKKLKKKFPNVEVVVEQPSTPKVRTQSPSIAPPTTSTGPSIFQTPQYPKSPSPVKRKQDAADEFSRASAKFLECRRISMQIQDDFSKQVHGGIIAKAASPSSTMANASKDEKDAQIDVLYSINHKLDRIAHALEELVESIPLFAK